jgi:hypothetical protein
LSIGSASGSGRWRSDGRIARIEVHVQPLTIHGVRLTVFFALGGICGSILAPSARSNAEVVSNPTPELDVIVVTARKRQENSQDVPISIIAMNGQQLDRSHTHFLTEFVQLIPNMQLQFINPRQTAFSIRGLGNNPASEGLETSVGLYLDGVAGTTFGISSGPRKFESPRPSIAALISSPAYFFMGSDSKRPAFLVQPMVPMRPNSIHNPL